MYRKFSSHRIDPTAPAAADVAGVNAVPPTTAEDGIDPAAKLCAVPALVILPTTLSVDRIIAAPPISSALVGVDQAIPTLPLKYESASP
jgi:hypothetical protein